MYYVNQEMAPFDTAFQQQIGQMAMQNQITNSLARAVAQCWENQKQQVVQQVKYRYQNMGGYNNQIIANTVNDFIRSTANQLLQNQMMMQQQYGNPMMMQQPIMGGNFGTNFNAVSFPIMQNGQVPVQPLYAETTPAKAPEVVQATPVQANQEQPTEQNSAIKSSFIDPVVDEPDSLYGDKELETSKGTIQVTSLRDGYGQPIKYVQIKLIDACFNAEEAISWAKRLYTKDTTYHIDIEYSKLDKLQVPYNVFSEFVTECKKFVTSTPASSGDLKYLQGIQKVLNQYPRGVADEIDGYLCDRFNTIAGSACCRSTDRDGAALSVNKFSALIELSNRDSANAVVQRWYKIPNFKEQFVIACNAAIREFILNVVVINPSTTENTPVLMRANSGLVVSSDLTLLDITKELFDRRVDFAIASDEDKKTKFGVAGKELMNSVVFIIGGQTVTVTKLLPEGIAGMSHGTPIIMMNNVIFGGYDADKKPCQITSLFEYFMVHHTMESRVYTDLVVEFKQASVKYGCSRCTDGSLIINTEK